MKIGDIVRLKSGSPKMTVTALLSEKAECSYFSSFGSDDEDDMYSSDLKNIVLPLDALTVLETAKELQ